ncbi:MAG: hypothetical protein ACTS3F_03565 [Phycisphaerales bacterium]
MVAAGTAAAAHAGLWINALGGAWSIASNWDPAIVPNGARAVAEIGVAGAYEVALPAGTTTLGELLLTNPDGVVLVPAAGTLSLSGGTATVDGVLQINNFSASGSSATLTATGDTEIVGGGTTRLMGLTFTRARITTTGEAVVTVAGGHTVAGAGQIIATVINNGSIIADEEGLELQLGASAMTNNGLFSASNGSILRLSSTAVDQAGGGQIFADGSGSLIDFVGNGSVLGGSLVATPDAPAMVRQAGTTTLQDVTLEAELLVVPVGTINLTGTALTNEGLLSVNDFSASGSAATLSVVDSVSLLGPGTVRLNGLSTTRARITSGGGVLTNSAEHTIAGAGQIISGFVNDGLIDADASGFELLIQTDDATNNSIIRASAGGLLDITSSIIDQTAGGQIIADGPDSLVEFIGTCSVLGGSLEATPGAPAMVRQAGTTTLQDVTLDAELLVVPVGTINLTGTALTNNGLLSVNNFNTSGSTATLGVVDSVSLLGTGTVRLNGLSTTRAQITGVGESVLTNSADHTIAGAGRILASFVNDGVIDADDPERQFQIQTATATNNNIIRASGGGWLTITSSTIDQSAGGQILADGVDSLVEFTANSTLLGGSLEATPDAPAMVRRAGATTLDGVLNNADLVIATFGTLNIVDDVFTNHGRIEIGDFSPSGSTATLSFLAANATASGTGEIAFSKPLGGVPRIVGTGTLTNDIGHTISGRGQVQLGLHNAGTIKPGDPTGLISVSGGYSAGASSVHHITINDAMDFSRITATGALAVDGDIVLSIDPGFLPAIGQQFAIITGSSAVGTMEVVSAPTIAGLVFAAITLEDRVVISVSVCADLNDDDIVNSDDLGLLLGNFGCAEGCTSDINGDGLVDSDDLGLLLGAFGGVCD